MPNGLESLLITAIIMAIIIAIAYVVVTFIASKFGQFAQIIVMLFWGIVAIAVLVKILIPLLHML